MAEKIPEEFAELMLRGKAAVLAEEYMVALNTFAEIYATGYKEGTAEGLSYYGVAVAMVNKKYKDAIDLCQKAIKLQFLNPHHYVNLARVYIAAGNRKKAVQSLEQGLGVLPGDRVIISFWKQVGIRARPAIPFLSRDNPLNVAIGRARRNAREKKKAREKQEKG